ncbi:putative jasmonic acid carboxyl methyltransferase 2 [Silene latifolia]|uniref:putative jasmonic acid carboxyl methyltransferase 2 n=1 Tax=Silene latifolia TaxID=37657 RepID=UPI003D786D96
MEIEKVLHMKKGVGDNSYAKNSSLQRTIMTQARPIIEESIREVYDTLRPECLMMADMGCSSGPNALLVVSRIIDIIDDATRSSNRQCPQFGVFLNDLPGNDFNALFNLLPSFNQALEEAKGSSFGPCLISGIPKSFYGRVPPHKVLTEVATILKNAGCALEPRDLDLRDCYRDCPEVRKPSVFKLSGPGSPNKKYLSPSSLTPPQASRATLQNYPYHGNCQLWNKIKSGPVLSFRPSAGPRLLSTAARHVEHGVPGILQKHLAYIAFKLKRGIKF